MRRILPLAAVAVAVAAAEKAMGWATRAVAMGVLVALAVQAVLLLRRDARLTVGVVPAAAPARRDVLAVVARLFPLFAAWIVVNVLLDGDIRDSIAGPEATSGYSPAFVLVLVVLIPLTIAGFALRVPRVGTGPRRLRRLVLPAVLLGLLAVKVAVVAGVAKMPGFDAGNVFIAAYTTGVPGQVPPMDFLDYYFGMLPNNLFLAEALAALFRAGALLGLQGIDAFVMLEMVANCLVLTAVELLTFLVVRRVWSARAAWWALAVVAVPTTLSPWLNTPYSDTIGMLFPITTVYLWLRFRAARGLRARFVLAAVVGIVTAAGVAVKPTTVFALVAIAAIEVVRGRRVLRRRRVLVLTAAMAGVAVASGALVSVGGTAVIDASRLTTFSVWTNPNSMPLTHFMKMGAQGDGGYSGEDVSSTLAVVPASERSAAALQVYIERVQAMGVEGYSLFLIRKALWTFSDGSFSQGKEGDPFTYPAWTPYNDKVHSWFLPGGTEHWYLSSLWQAVWILLLGAAALPVSRFASPGRRRIIDAGRLSMLLLLAFLLLFETRARYVYLYVPVMVVLAVGAASAVPAALTAARAGLAYRVDRLRLPTLPRPTLPRPAVRLPSPWRRTVAPMPAAEQPERQPEPVR